MTKLFPGLLAVLALAWLLARGERTAALRGAAIFAAVVVAISLPFAGSGYVDSYRFHLDRPVQIESSAASVLFALGGSEVTGTNLRPDRFKSNGLDGGHAQRRAHLFTIALVLALAWIVALAARRPDARHFVLCAFAALLAFVVLGKVFSPQFVIWLAPFAALAWVWRQRAVALLTAIGIVLTHVEFPSRYFDLVQEHPDVIKLVAARNALLLVALVVLAHSARACRGSARRHVDPASPSSAISRGDVAGAPRRRRGASFSSCPTSDDQRLPQRPSAPARPRLPPSTPSSRAEAARAALDDNVQAISAVAGRDRRRPRRAEVDHGREPAVAHEQVAGRDVAVKPHRLPASHDARHRGRPHPQRPRRAGSSSPSTSIAWQRLLLVVGQRPAAVEVVLPGLGPPVASAPAERVQEAAPASSANSAEVGRSARATASSPSIQR